MLFSRNLRFLPVSFLSGEVLYLWLLLPTSDCRMMAECRRYNDDLTAFLRRKKTIRDIGRECIAAVAVLQLDLYNKQDKFAGYRRHGIKNGMGAMTTSPAETQVSKTRQTGVSARTHMDKSISTAIGRCIKTLGERHAKAQRDIALSNYISRAPTAKYVSFRGQGLIDREHDQSYKLKSARMSSHLWITWNNFAVDAEDTRHNLFRNITHIMRVSRLVLSQDQDKTWFIKCNCGKREDIGVPCDCYFRIASNAGIDENEVVQLCMIDPIHINTWETHYSSRCQIGTLLHQAQKKAFDDEHKGIRITQSLAERFLQQKTPPGENSVTYPILGPFTSAADMNEVRFMLAQEVCTKYDLQRYRSGEASADASTGNIVVGGVDGPLESTPFRGAGHLSVRSRQLLNGNRDDTPDGPPETSNAMAEHDQSRMEGDVPTSPVGVRLGQMKTQQKRQIHSRINKTIDTTKQTVLKAFHEATNHTTTTAARTKALEHDLIGLVSDFEKQMMERIEQEHRHEATIHRTDCFVNYDNMRKAVAAASARRTTVPSNQSPTRKRTRSQSGLGELKLCGEEDPSYVSPSLDKRFRGPL